MLIGILADIHDAVPILRRALSAFDRAGVDQVVTLGDAFESFDTAGPSAQAARLLSEVDAIGVWGNHDVGLSLHVSERLQQQADPQLLEFASRLEPHLVINDCRFSHIEPWLDPSNPSDLWYFDGIPDTRERAARCFEAVPEKFLFMGHHHQCIVMSPQERIDWDCKTELSLTSEDRYLVVSAAVADGWCSMFDTVDALLTPIRFDA